MRLQLRGTIVWGDQGPDVHHSRGEENDTHQFSRRDETASKWHLFFCFSSSFLSLAVKIVCFP